MSVCALCAADPASPVTLAPGEDEVLLCRICATALSGTLTPGPHWRCHDAAIWAAKAPTQIAAWRLLKALSDEAWAAVLLESACLEPEVLSGA